MKKLELKHLAPYLDYKLGFIEHETKQILSGLDTYIHANWTEPYQFSDMEQVCYSSIDYSSMWSLKEIKPIFHPMSDLDKYLNKLSEWLYNQEPESFNDVWGAKKWIKAVVSLESNEIGSLPYKIVDKLIEWHFNVFDLPEELFIDINTL
jgi:hypothetical protein